MFDTTLAPSPSRRRFAFLTRPLPTAARFALAVSTLVLALPADATIVRSAAGDLATVTAARDQFRADVGGGTTSSGGGLFGGVRREITWDGTPDDDSAPFLLPNDAFQGRGVVFATEDGDGVAVSAKTGNPSNAPVEFGDVNPIYEQLFAAFSPQRLFASIGSPVFDVHFLVAGTNAPGLSTAFGAVFTDVDDAGSTIEFFDADDQSLGSFDVPAAVGDETFSFLGVTFPTAQVSWVRVTAGSAWLDAGGEPTDGDAVALDDFLYGEPQARNDDACVTTPTALCLNGNRFRVEVSFAAASVGTGDARGFAITSDSGVLSFFNESNLEQLIKVLNGCVINNRFWVYAASATNVEYLVTVTDTETGTVKTYFKAEGPPAPAINDSAAFATCP